MEITEGRHRRRLAGTIERLANLAPPQERGADQLRRAGEYLETPGPVWEVAMLQERKEIYRPLLGVVYVDVLEKRLVELVAKGVSAPLFGDRPDVDRRDDHHQ